MIYTKKNDNKYNENEARQIIRVLSIKDDYEQVQLSETKNVNWLTDNVLDNNQGNDNILTKLERDYLRKHLVYAYDNSSPPILGEAYLELAPSQTEAKAVNSAIFNSVASQYIDKLIDLLDDDQVNSFKNARLGTGLNFPPDVFQDSDTILEKREKLKTKIKNAGPISERIRGQIWFGVGQSYEEKRSKASYIKELNAILEGSVRTIFGLQFGDINYDLYLHQTTPIENLVKQYIYILIFSK